MLFGSFSQRPLPSAGLRRPFAGAEKTDGKNDPGRVCGVNVPKRKGGQGEGASGDRRGLPRVSLG